MSTRFYCNPYGAGLCERPALSGSWRRGSAIRVVAFRASHPAKLPPRQRRFIQRFLKHVLVDIPERRLRSDGNKMAQYVWTMSVFRIANTQEYP